MRGHRIENLSGEAMVVADAVRIHPAVIALIVFIPVLAALLIYLLIGAGAKKRRRKDDESERSDL